METAAVGGLVAGVAAAAGEGLVVPVAVIAFDELDLTGGEGAGFAVAAVGVEADLIIALGEAGVLLGGWLAGAVLGGWLAALDEAGVLAGGGLIARIGGLVGRAVVVITCEELVRTGKGRAPGAAVEAVLPRALEEMDLVGAGERAAPSVTAAGVTEGVAAGVAAGVGAGASVGAVVAGAEGVEGAAGVTVGVVIGVVGGCAVGG